MILGYIFVPIIIFIHFNVNPLFGIMLNIPMLIDGYTQLKGLRKSTNFLRSFTGILSGIGQSIIIVYFAQLLIELISKLPK